MVVAREGVEHGLEVDRGGELGFPGAPGDDGAAESGVFREFLVAVETERDLDRGKAR